MNSTLETIRDSWLTRDREVAEENRHYLRQNIDEISAEFRDKFLSVLKWAENTEQLDDIVDHSIKQSATDSEEVQFIERQNLSSGMAGPNGGLQVHSSLLRVVLHE